jgi:AraC-like DNA-binding protein
MSEGTPFAGAGPIMVRVPEGGPALERLLPDVRCTVIRAGWWPSGPEWNLPERVLPHYVLFVCVDGAADFLVGGEWHRVEAGTLLLVPPNLPHEGQHAHAHPFRHCGFHFFARLYGVLDMPVLYGLPLLFRPGAEAAARIVRLIEAMVGELAAGETACTLAANGICAHILALLCREVVTRADPGSGQGGHNGQAVADGARLADLVRLAPVFQTIHARYAGPVTLQELAGLVDLHPAYFTTLFRRVAGHPPIRYLARYRLDRARELLVCTDLPVTEIAHAVGFADLAYFDRVFRRTAGTSPGEYRRSNRSPTVP